MLATSAEFPDGLEEALSLIRAAMDEAATRRIAPNVAVWALVLEAIGRLTEIHGAQAAADFLASLQSELRRQALSANEGSHRVN
jgi:hypothetical protein